jgi:hypothetical protein
MIPPSKNPYASGKPGMIACETIATSADVKMTKPNASRLIGLLIFQKSFHDVFHAAAYNKGGRKIRKTNSGCRVICGMPGIKLIINPPITKNMG